MPDAPSRRGDRRVGVGHQLGDDLDQVDPALREVLAEVPPAHPPGAHRSRIHASTHVGVDPSSIAPTAAMNRSAACQRGTSIIRRDLGRVMVRLLSFGLKPLQVGREGRVDRAVDDEPLAELVPSPAVATRLDVLLAERSSRGI